MISSTGSQSAVRRCTATVILRRDGTKTFAGTGFFVAQGLILTCSHVLIDREGADLLVGWSGKEWPCLVEAELPSPFPKDGSLPDGLPDLALLRCGASNHEVLLLDPECVASPGSSAFIYGFSEEPDGTLAGYPVLINIEGEIDLEPNWRLLKFDSARVLRGQSGCAVLSEASGLVIAVAKRRIGGPTEATYGIPAATVFDKLPALVVPQRDYRQKLQPASSEPPLLPLPEPNPFFFGRGEELRHLAATLVSSPCVGAVLGIPGIGKSALAREYVLDSRSRYVETLWLDARDESIARCALAVAAQRLGLPPQASDLKTLTASVYAALSQAASTWLLVLDGLEDISLGRLLLPALPATRVLITSRLNDLRLLGARDPVRLAPLDPDTAAMLVKARLCGMEITPELESAAAASGNIPGALEQAAAAALQAKAATGRWPERPPQLPGRIQAALAAEPGAALLRLLSVLAPAPFPIAALAGNPDDRAPWAATRALTLPSLAWTDPLGETISLDSQTRDTVAQSLDKSALEAQKREALSILSNNLGAALLRRDSRKFILLLIPHALHLVRKLSQAEKSPADLLFRTHTARALVFLGDYNGAFEQLAAIQSEVMAAGPPVYGVRITEEYLLSFAAILITMARLDPVESLLNKAGELLDTYPLESLGGPPDIAEYIRVNISAHRGKLYAAQARPEQALDHLVPALEYFAHHPRGALDAASTLDSVIACLMASGTRQGPIYAVLSSNPSLAINSLTVPGTGNIGKAVALLPRLAESLKGTPFALEAEARLHLYLGIAFLRTAGNIFPGCMIQLQNAEQHLLSALEAADRGLPDPSEVTASCCVNLGVLMNRSKSYRGVPNPLEAIKYLRRAIDIRTRMYGQATPRLNIAFFQLAVALIDTGEERNLPEAKASLQRVLACHPDPTLAADAQTQLTRLAPASR